MPFPRLFLLLPLLALAPAAPRPDYAGLYADGPRLTLDTRREADSLRLYLHLPDANDLGPNRALRLTAWPAYEARQALWQDTVPRRQQHRQPDGAGGLHVHFALAQARVPAGAVLQLAVEPAAGSAADAPGGYQDAASNAWLPLTAERLSRGFVLTDSAGRALGRRWVRVGETFGLAQFGLEQPVRWRRYDAPLAPALPPMTDPATQPRGPRSLALRDSATAPAGAVFRFALPGLYALRVGGAGGVPVRTVAVLVGANDYPNLTSAGELIEPLRYLTTSQERQKLSSAADPKRAVDRFWLDIAHGDQGRARGLIRGYYGRVAAANALFAAHKDGWLTDRGLLYVVLGPPPSVRRLANGDERWFYPEGGERRGPVTFSFRARPSTFAPDYYELVRRPEYELLWYAAVEQWRTATTAPSGPNGRSGR